MEKLKELTQLCKAGILIEINEHKSYYQSVETYLGENIRDLEETKDEVICKMIDTDTTIKLNFYPDSPRGHYTLYHYDLDLILDEARQIIKEHCKR